MDRGTVKVSRSSSYSYLFLNGLFGMCVGHIFSCLIGSEILGDMDYMPQETFQNQLFGIKIHDSKWQRLIFLTILVFLFQRVNQPDRERIDVYLNIVRKEYYFHTWCQWVGGGTTCSLSETIESIDSYCLLSQQLETQCQHNFFS